MTPTERAQLALEGLSIGDAFGSRELPYSGLGLLRRSMPPPPWPWSDETAIGAALASHLADRGYVDQDDLATLFARVYALEAHRGYDMDSIRLFPRIYGGTAWQYATPALHDGKGSASNGAASRIAPLGAYFADDLARCVAEARAAAEITHSTEEGQAGAIAVALAAATVWNNRELPLSDAAPGLLALVHARTPDGRVKDGLAKAMAVPFEADLPQATEILGNGAHDDAVDTVPFALWMAARHLADFEQAMWRTADGYGDMNTNCAIVGALVALRVGYEGIPGDWASSREELPRILAVSR